MKTQHREPSQPDRPGGRMTRLDLRLPAELKAAFFDGCDERGLVPSDEIRRLMEARVAEWREDDVQRALKLLGKSEDPDVIEAVRILSNLQSQR